MYGIKQTRTALPKDVQEEIVRQIKEELDRQSALHGTPGAEMTPKWAGAVLSTFRTKPMKIRRSVTVPDSATLGSDGKTHKRKRSPSKAQRSATAAPSSASVSLLSTAAETPVIPDCIADAITAARAQLPEPSPTLGRRKKKAAPQTDLVVGSSVSVPATIVQQTNEAVTAAPRSDSESTGRTQRPTRTMTTTTRPSRQPFRNDAHRRQERARRH